MVNSFPVRQGPLSHHCSPGSPRAALGARWNGVAGCRMRSTRHWGAANRYLCQLLLPQWLGSAAFCSGDSPVRGPRGGLDNPK